MQGLTEQAPVYVRGFKVGQVEEITYDFAQDTAFNIVVSLNKDIRVVEGSELRLVPDGLLGGMTVEVIIPAGQELAEIPAHSQLPTSVKPSMIDGLAGPIIASLDSTLSSIRALVDNVNGQIEKDQLRTILAHADELLTSLKATSSKLDGILKNDVPHIMQEVDGILTDVKKLSANASEADIAALVARADATLAEVNQLVEAANNPNGTTGKLLHDESLYNNLNSTLQSADSLMQDLREQPNSVIWGKKKKKK